MGVMGRSPAFLDSGVQSIDELGAHGSAGLPLYGSGVGLCPGQVGDCAVLAIGGSEVRMGRVGWLVGEVQLGHEVVDGDGLAIDSDSEQTLEHEGGEGDTGLWVADRALIAHLDRGRMGREREEGFQVFDPKNILKVKKLFFGGFANFFGQKVGMGGSRKWLILLMNFSMGRGLTSIYPFGTLVEAGVPPPGGRGPSSRLNASDQKFIFKLFGF